MSAIIPWTDLSTDEKRRRYFIRLDKYFQPDIFWHVGRYLSHHDAIRLASTSKRMANVQRRIYCIKAPHCDLFDAQYHNIWAEIIRRLDHNDLVRFAATSRWIYWFLAEFYNLAQDPPAGWHRIIILPGSNQCACTFHITVLAFGYNFMRSENGAAGLRYAL